MNRKIIRTSKYYKVEYREFENHEGYGWVQARCIPDEGINLYEIKATYAKQHPCNKYYVFAKTKKEARKRFKDTLTWLHIIESICEVNKNEIEKILCDPYQVKI